MLTVSRFKVGRDNIMFGGVINCYMECILEDLSPGLGRSPEEGWQPSPVFLPGESPWTEEPGLLQSMGSQRVGHD